MKIHSLLFLLSAFISFSFPNSADAQTCRVSTGKCENGCLSYKEVFEYDYVEQKPEFPGGGQCMVNFINEHRRYPEAAYIKGIEGRVTCSFVVNSNGSISNITVMKGVESSLNDEAVRIISKMPEWSPGKIGGHAVPVRVICAIPFRK